MNPIDVYKKLPQNNCGQCSVGTCMSFAVQLLRRLVSLDECNGLDEAGRIEIEASLGEPGDWKERRLEELLKEISGMKFSDSAEGIGAVTEDDVMKIKYMDRDVYISKSGFKDEMDIWDKLLIVMYIKQAGKASLSHKWTAFRELKDGLIRAESFKGACELSLARMFEHNKEGMLNRLNAMGAEKVSGQSTEYSFIVYPLPKIPFLVLLWPADEEFGAECKVLFDTTVTEFLDVETLLYLGMALVRAIKESQ
jgi:hypothetical protein